MSAECRFHEPPKRPPGAHRLRVFLGSKKWITVRFKNFPNHRFGVFELHCMLLEAYFLASQELKLTCYNDLTGLSPQLVPSDLLHLILLHFFLGRFACKKA